MPDTTQHDLPRRDTADIATAPRRIHVAHVAFPDFWHTTLENPVKTALGAASLALALGAVAATVAPAAADAAGTKSAGTSELKTADVSFRTSDGQTLGGRIFEPANATGKLPGLLLVHGSGQGNKWSELQKEAEEFAKQGMVVLAPDKRSVGYSKLNRDYSQLADDALKAFAVLRNRPEVDPAKTGVWGLSEGGWVAPIAVTRNSEIKFMITVGGPGLEPLRTQAWNMANKVDRAGIEGSARTLLNERFYRVGADAGMFPEAHYDPVPTLKKIHQPVLALWGAEDNQIPPAESAEVFSKTLPGSVTIKFFPHAPHALWAGGREAADELVPGYAETVGAWVRDVTGGHVPASSADPLPAQPTRSVPLPESAWWEGWQAQLIVLVLLIVAFATYPVAALVRRRRGGTGGSWPARILAASGLISVPLSVYAAVSMIGSANGHGIDLGPLIAGRPILWLVVQLLAFTTLISTVVTATRLRTARLREWVLITGGLLFIPWALYWGQLLP
ncbi:alpha/beta hydrolase family protein [Microtetraspora malaysiensis]|uniref:alpha/beta hydrolase family protein n=1 Tax=Microtetraspora malaysiensis TaxID=161358 RepID=UPI003D8FAF64